MIAQQHIIPFDNPHNISTLTIHPAILIQIPQRHLPLLIPNNPYLNQLSLLPLPTTNTLIGPTGFPIYIYMLIGSILDIIIL